MLIGHIDRLDRHYLSGWAVDTENPEAIVEIAVLVNGQEWKRIKADNPRTDLFERGDFGHGAHGFTYLFDRPMSLLFRYSIKLVGYCNGNSRPIAERELVPPSGISRPRTPVLVTASGRSGTTILMKHLSASKSIITYDKYPYEMKMLSYYCKAFDVMTASPSIDATMPADAFYKDPNHLAANPFNHFDFEAAFGNTTTLYEFFDQRAAPRVAEAFRSTILEFYELLADQHEKSDSVYFAEKVDILHPTRNFVRLAFADMKEIVLVRDPRDLFCSYRSFWQSPSDEALSALKSIADEMVRLHSSQDKNKIIFVKYEDLVLQTDRTLYNISRFLNLDQDLEADPTSDAELFKSHGTSENISASVNRWKKDLNSGEIEQFEFIFNDFLEMYNYGIS